MFTQTSGNIVHKKRLLDSFTKGTSPNNLTFTHYIYRQALIINKQINDES